jgi:hypothetical protein
MRWGAVRVWGGRSVLGAGSDPRRVGGPFWDGLGSGPRSLTVHGPIRSGPRVHTGRVDMIRFWMKGELTYC